MALNDNSFSNSQPITVDPNFFVPPSLINLEYVDNDRPTNESEDAVLAVDDANSETIYLTEPGYVEENVTGLLPPSVVTVVSQTVKIAADGTQVIDLVLDIQDVVGATDYEVRYSRV